MMSLAVQCVALAIAGTLARPAAAQTAPVNSEVALNAAISAANTSGAASTVIELGSTFSGSGILTSPTHSVTIDTGAFALTGNMTTSAPITVFGSASFGLLTFDGTLIGGISTTGGALEGLRIETLTSFVISNASITGGDGALGAGAGVTVRNAGSFTNTGTIKGGTPTTVGAGADGLDISGTATVTNTGTISGGNNHGGASSGIGVSLTNAAATLINTGVISGGSDTTGATVGGVGLLTSGGTQPIVNSGTISGGNGAVAVEGTAGNVSLVNSGKIAAGSGQADAILFNTGTTATLELQAGSTIVGNVVADAASTNTLILGGSANDAFDVSSIGPSAQYQNFNVFEKTGTGTWALTGTAMSSTPWTISQGTLQIGNGGTTGSVIGNITDNATLALDRSDVSTFDNLVSGTGAVSQIGTGTTVLTAANTYTGGTNVMAGTLAIDAVDHPGSTIGTGLVSIAAGGTFGGYGIVAGAVDNSGTVAVGNAVTAFASQGTGTLQIGGDLTNAGIVNLAASSGHVGNVLNVAGNYVGQNGQLTLSAVLNAGGATAQADQFVVAGNTSGTTALKVVNAGGTGAQTTGDGIQVIQVNGTSAANSFRLGGAAQAGAYEYLLYQGGTANANDWYLRSQLEASDAPDPDATGGGAAGSAIAYRPGVVGYSITPMLNADYGYTVLGRLHERVGDVASLESPQPASSNGIWGRLDGQNLDADAGDRFSADEHTFFAQFGKDWTLSRGNDGGSTHAGATLTIGSTSASFDDSARSIAGLSDSAGSVETQAQTIGGYWTKYLPDGSYFDGVGQLTHYQNRYGDIYGDSGSQDGVGAAVSGEAGKAFEFGSTGVAIEPQAQLIYQYLHLNHFDDGISEISANTTNGLRGRLGFRLFAANLSNDTKSSTITPEFTADVLHDFFSPGQTTIGSTSFDNELGKTWYDVGVGITGSFGEHSEVYASVKYEHNINGEYRRNVYGQGGYRYSW